MESQAIDIGRSKPVNMPLSSAYPVLIECGSVSSCEPSPKLLDTYHHNFEDNSGAGELQLKEDLAEAMLESPGVREGKLFVLFYLLKIFNNCILLLIWECLSLQNLPFIFFI